MLNLDLATILFQVANFLILAFLLNRFLFKPILRKAEQRAAEKERLLQELAEERQKLADVRADLEKKKQQLDDTLDETLASAQEQANEERRQLLNEARLEAGQMLVEAQADAVRVQRQAMHDFREQLLEVLLDTSGTLIRSAAPQVVHDALVLEVNERIREMGRNEMQRVEALRSSLAGREAVAKISSAVELTDSQRAQLAQILTSLADQHVEMHLDVDPKLVSGLRVRLGDTVIDNSISGRLSELREQARNSLKEKMDRA